MGGLSGQVANGSFETNGGVGTSIFANWAVVDQAGGSGSWFVQTGTGSPLNGFPVPAPTDGTFAAMTDQGGPGSHLLYQNIAVPATGGTLSFDIFIQNQAGVFFIPSPESLDFNVFPNQHARVDIMTTASAVDDVGAGVLQNLYITNPGDPATSGYTNVSASLAAYAGTTVRLRFAEVDNQLFFNLGIDNVKLVSGAGGGTLTDLSPAHLWIGLRNSDDQGTQFDLKVELLQNGNPVASGLQRCITGVTRNPNLAKEAIVDWDAFPPETLASGDVLALRVSTRVGTTAAGAKCAGPGGSHNNARGLRIYYDSTGRPSRFDATIDPNPSEDLYLHSNGGTCPNGDGDSPGVTARTLDSNPPTAANPRCKDSGTINFNGGNPFSLIGIWSLAPLP